MRLIEGVLLVLCCIVLGLFVVYAPRESLIALGCLGVVTLCSLAAGWLLGRVMK